MFVVGGESLIDLVPVEPRADGTICMEAHAGGSPMNCAMALSLLGQDSGFMCPISVDGFGDYILKPLTASGVKPLLADRVAAPTTLAVVALNARGQAQYQFYREADRAFTRESLLAALPDKPSVFQIGGFCAIEPEDADVWFDVALEAARRGAVVSIDPNVRPTLVSDFASYKERLDRFFDITHLIKISDEDLAALDDSKTIETHAEALLAHKNCELVVVTLGEGGSRAFTKSAHASAEIYRPAEFGDTVGAGDSLMAGVLSRIADKGALTPDGLAGLDEAALEDILHYGAVVAGLNCAHKGCHPPRRDEVEAVLAG